MAAAALKAIVVILGLMILAGLTLMGAILASYARPGARGPAAAQNFVDGLHAALITSACIAFAAAIVAVTTVHVERRRRAPVAAESL